MSPEKTRKCLHYRFVISFVSALFYAYDKYMGKGRQYLIREEKKKEKSLKSRGVPNEMMHCFTNNMIVLIRQIKIPTRAFPRWIRH